MRGFLEIRKRERADCNFSRSIGGSRHVLSFHRRKSQFLRSIDSREPPMYRFSSGSKRPSRQNEKRRKIPLKLVDYNSRSFDQTVPPTRPIKKMILKTQLNTYHRHRPRPCSTTWKFEILTLKLLDTSKPFSISFFAIFKEITIH